MSSLSFRSSETNPISRSNQHRYYDDIFRVTYSFELFMMWALNERECDFLPKLQPVMHEIDHFDELKYTAADHGE